MQQNAHCYIHHQTCDNIERTSHMRIPQTQKHERGQNEQSVVTKHQANPNPNKHSLTTMTVFGKLRYRPSPVHRTVLLVASSLSRHPRSFPIAGWQRPSLAIRVENCLASTLPRSQTARRSASIGIWVTDGSDMSGAYHMTPRRNHLYLLRVSKPCLEDLPHCPHKKNRLLMQASPKEFHSNHYNLQPELGGHFTAPVRYI